MSPSNRLYLKVFFIAGILFAAMMFGVDLLFRDVGIFWKYIFQGVLFGVAMSLTGVSVQRKNIKKLGLPLSEDNLKVSHHKQITSKLGKDQLVEKIEKDPILQVMKKSIQGDTITLQTKMSWQSWGEEIKIKAEPTDSGNINYQLSSQPKLKTTLIDYGKNLRNILQVEKLLNSSLQ